MHLMTQVSFFDPYREKTREHATITDFSNALINTRGVNVLRSSTFYFKPCLNVGFHLYA